MFPFIVTFSTSKVLAPTTPFSKTEACSVPTRIPVQRISQETIASYLPAATPSSIHFSIFDHSFVRF